MWRRTSQPSSRRRWTRSRILTSLHYLDEYLWSILMNYSAVFYDYFSVFLMMHLTRYKPTWHCIVGRNFGSYVTHETRWDKTSEQMLKPNCFQAFHLLLPRTSGRPPFQEWLIGQIKIFPPGHSHFL